ncbi:MAG: hypothetical protein PHC68_18685 [Syntrophorhabdaceae bacterium]|nr:hypothetical protein [Syntrophorhabdaceae bacterium]
MQQNPISCDDQFNPPESEDPNFILCTNQKNKTGSCLCSWILEHGLCPKGLGNKTNDICPICNKPLEGSGKALTSMEDGRIVHLGCLIAQPCDCQYELAGCRYKGPCEKRLAPDKDLNGTWIPTCGVKFPKSDASEKLKELAKKEPSMARVAPVQICGTEIPRITNIEDLIRCGCIIADGNPNDPAATKYRGVFVKGNFLLYRFVRKGDHYRGYHYGEDGYLQAWSDMQGELIMPAPQFVPLKVKRED